MSFGHPLVLLGIPGALLAPIVAASIWASGAIRPAPALLSPGVEARRSPTLPLSRLFTPQVLRWEGEIHRWATEVGLDANLVAVVIQIESCGDPRAVSPSGALGLFQVMPFHFQKADRPLDVETNARRGLDYLARAWELAQGRSDLALAGYNGGHGVIGRSPHTWPAETRRYVSWGSGILADISAGLTESSTLRAWLRAGGERLCRRAELHWSGS